MNKEYKDELEAAAKYHVQESGDCEVMDLYSAHEDTFIAGANWQKAQDDKILNQCLGYEKIKMNHVEELSKKEFWTKGEPPKVYRSEWFIAKLKDGTRAVLRELPNEYTYDYKTADETHCNSDWVVAWSQFPDSGFITPEEVLLNEAVKVIGMYADEDSWGPSNAQTCPSITNGDVSNWSLNNTKYVGGHAARKFLQKFGDRLKDGGGE